MRTPIVERAIVSHFGARQNVICPNVTWGWGLRHEADLVILRPSGWADEVEIKVSKSDLKADANKSHGHRSDRFKRLWFAMPEKMRDCLDLVPQRAGVLLVIPSKSETHWPSVQTLRAPQINKDARRLTDIERIRLLELIASRYWSLKQREYQRYADYLLKQKRLQPKGADQ